MFVHDSMLDIQKVLVIQLNFLRIPNTSKKHNFGCSMLQRMLAIHSTVPLIKGGMNGSLGPCVCTLCDCQTNFNTLPH